MPHQCTNCGHVFEDGSKEMLSGCPECSGNKFQYHPGEVPDEQPTDAEPPERDSGSVTDAVGRAANKVRDAVSSGDESEELSRQPDETSSTPVEAAGDRSSASEPADPDASATGEESSATNTATEPTDSPAAESSDPADDGFDSLDPSTETSAAGEPRADSDAELSADATSTEDSAQASARSDVVDKDSLPDASNDGRVVKEPDEEEDRPDLEELRQELNDQFESIRIVAPGQYELNLMELYDRQEYIIALQENGKYVIEVPDAWDAPDPRDPE